MPRKSIGETAMTDAERQARYRAARAAGKPVVRVRRALDHRGRARRWTDHVAGLVEAQVEYAAWLRQLAGQSSGQCDRRSIAGDLRSRSDRAAGDPTTARLRQGLTNPSPTSRTTACTGGSTGTPPRAAASASRWALRVARVPPMDYRHKPPRRGVNFGRR